MQSPDLIVICAVAFCLVFSLLAVLALLMRLIMVLFPEKKGAADPALIAALAAAVQGIFPGAKISKIEEKNR